MRIFVAGASGVLGRAALPHLVREHLVVGLTRSAEKATLLAGLGAEPVVGDAYEGGALARLVEAARPEIVVNFLTDLAGGPGPANDRIRTEGGANVLAAARRAGARRLVVESVAFPLEGPAGEAVAELESAALTSGLEALVLRFGLLWGPGTWSPEPPAGPSVSAVEAGRRAAELLLHGQPGVHVVSD